MEKLNTKVISENIGWDGTYFYCRRCGKSGYSKMQSIKGHLSMCPGKAIQKGAIQLANQPATASHSPVGTMSIGNVESSPASQPATTAKSDNSQILSRISALENEYNHMLVENNNPVSSSDWISRNKDMLIILGILVVLYLILQESKCKCANESSGRARANGFSSTLANRAASKAIDYGLNEIFKKR
jgi:hypothetical protein